jgi:hypothetical protein
MTKMYKYYSDSHFREGLDQQKQKTKNASPNQTA